MIKKINDVAIVVPLYKDKLTNIEKKSLNMLTHYLDKFDIYYITHCEYEYINKGSKIIHFPKSYFKSTHSYSQLLMNKIFYSSFESYKYILIYQLDCLVFSKDLLKWCDLGYDYIGAPLFKKKNNPNSGFSRVGNGGLSLRKVDSFLKVLSIQKPPNWLKLLSTSLPDRPFWDIKKKMSVYKDVRHGIDWYTKHYSLNEDLFWSDRAKLFYPDFNIAPIEVGLKFAFEAHPRYCYKKNNFQLPFGAHAWGKWDKEFWEKQMKGVDY